MKILYVTTIGLTMGFFENYIQELIAEGHQVDIACNETENPVPECYREWGCTVYPLSCSRSPFQIGTVLAVLEIRKIVSDHSYQIVHCHTPIAAACTRVACRKARKSGVRVIYTAHGFHFYTGAHWRNWLLYYPVEWICAHFTDVLITINQEDYRRAQRNMHSKHVEYVPGVGIDVDKFADTKGDRIEKRREIGIPEDALMILSVGELNANKNHQIVLRAMAEIANTSLHYVIAGRGEQKEALKELARTLGLSNRVHLLGYRTDVADLYQAADIYTLPSIREGLNVSIMEAMAGGLPCAVSDIRGNVDLIDVHGGALFDPASVEACVMAVKTLLDGNRETFGAHNAEKVKSFDYKTVARQMREIYKREVFYGNQA